MKSIENKIEALTQKNEMQKKHIQLLQAVVRESYGQLNAFIDKIDGFPGFKKKYEKLKEFEAQQ